MLGVRITSLSCAPARHRFSARASGQTQTRPSDQTVAGKPDAVVKWPVLSRRLALGTGAATVALPLGLLGGAEQAMARPLAVVNAQPLEGESGELVLSIALPPGYHYTKGANSRYEVEAEGVKVNPPTGSLSDGKDIKLQVTGAGGGGGAVKVACTVYFCREDDICLLQRVRFDIPVKGGATPALSPLALVFSVPAEAVGGGGSASPAPPAPAVSAFGSLPSLDNL